MRTNNITSLAAATIEVQSRVLQDMQEGTLMHDEVVCNHFPSMHARIGVHQFWTVDFLTSSCLHIATWVPDMRQVLWHVSEEYPEGRPYQSKCEAAYSLQNINEYLSLHCYPVAPGSQREVFARCAFN